MYNEDGACETLQSDPTSNYKKKLIKTLTKL